jgi:glycosyltransferase involved in cell wall biosynthesis
MTQTIVHFSDSDTFGGTEQELLITLAGLDRGRWNPILFHVAAPGIQPLIEGAKRLDIAVRSLPPMPLGMEGARHVPRAMYELRRVHASVFHAHLSWPLSCKYGLLAAILARVPAIVATEQLFVDYPWDRAILVQHRLMMLKIDRYVAVSEHVAQRLRNTFHVPPHKLEVIYNAIPTARFDRPACPEFRRTLSAMEERPIVLTIARLDEQKGLKYLLQTAQSVPDAVFVLVGDGPERSALESQAQSLGVDGHVVFLGHRQDIPDLLANCDLFVLPSLFEGLPVSVLEAMAAGKPVIASDIGGTDEAVVHGVSGLLVPPGDAEALAAAIQKLLLDAPLRQEFGKAGKARAVSVFSAESMVQRVSSLYEALAPVHASS